LCLRHYVSHSIETGRSSSNNNNNNNHNNHNNHIAGEQKASGTHRFIEQVRKELDVL
jgi:hypothetical protein